MKRRRDAVRDAYFKAERANFCDTASFAVAVVLRRVLSSQHFVVHSGEETISFTRSRVRRSFFHRFSFLYFVLQSGIVSARKRADTTAALADETKICASSTTLCVTHPRTIKHERHTLEGVEKLENQAADVVLSQPACFFRALRRGANVTAARVCRATVRLPGGAKCNPTLRWDPRVCSAPRHVVVEL